MSEQLLLGQNPGKQKAGLVSHAHSFGASIGMCKLFFFLNVYMKKKYVRNMLN